MEDEAKQILQKLLTHPYFEKAKRVREVSAGHTEDSVYTHLMQTLDNAKKSVDGAFITNPEAHSQFQAFMDMEIEGQKYFSWCHIVERLM